jgi:pimeloyl-ACP methyl ester carboxylesterase
MGGMIAQELALAHPERVSTLVLGCTSPGGSKAAGASELYSEIAEFRDTIAVDGPNLDWFAEFLQRLWTEEAIAKADRNLQDFVFSIIRYPPTKHGLRWQADAIEDHDAFERLHQISRPTLVATGADDALIDPDNSRLLADLIPHAELHIFDGLRHAFHLERPELVNSTIIEFIERARSNGHAAQ